MGLSVLSAAARCNFVIEKLLRPKPKEPVRECRINQIREKQTVGSGDICAQISPMLKISRCLQHIRPPGQSAKLETQLASSHLRHRPNLASRVINHPAIEP